MSKKNNHFINKSPIRSKVFSVLPLSCRASPSLWVSFIFASAVLLGLSAWQLNKGIHRQNLEQAQQQVKTKNQGKDTTLSQTFRDWARDPWSINDSELTIAGHFQANAFILHDNRVLNRTPGYAVYAPFQLDQNVTFQNKTYNHILVNLGWHQIVNFDRNLPPSVAIKPVSYVTLSLEHINNKVFTLDKVGIQAMPIPESGQADSSQVESSQALKPSQTSNIYRAQKINLLELDQKLDLSLLPFVGRSLYPITLPELAPFQNPVAQRGISAAKHFGYSFQWFIFWCIAVGVFIYTQCSWYSIRKA